MEATNYFIGEEFFGDVIAVNITCMMVLSSIYIAVSGSLPATSDVKYVEIWLLFSLVYPFLVVLINTYIHVEKSKAKMIVADLNNTTDDVRDGLNMLKRKLQKITRLRVAHFTAEYILPLVFCSFTICYFIVCSMTAK